MTPLYNFQGSIAPLSVLAFLATAALLTALAVAFLVLTLRGRGELGSRLGAAAVCVLLAYAVVLGGFSLASRGRSVQPGNRKYFCELDCHLAYQVVGSRRVAALGASRPAGGFQVVTLRVWFDPATTSPRRGNGPLFPNPRRAWLVDAAGTRYAPSAAGMAALQGQAGAQPLLTTALRPGESYQTSLVFELPAAATPAQLLLSESDPVTRLLIGHENSLGHRPVPFLLPVEAAAAAVRG